MLGEAEEHTLVKVTTEPLPEGMRTECPVTPTPEPTDPVAPPTVTAPAPTPVATPSDEPTLPVTGNGDEVPMLTLAGLALLLLGGGLLARKRSV